MCCTILATLLFTEAEEKAAQDLSVKTGDQRAELVRSLSLNRIKACIPGGEKTFIRNLVRLMGHTQPEAVVLQGVLCLMVLRLLPGDPVLKTKYLRDFKALGVPGAVFNILSQPHAWRDAEVRPIATGILEYFAHPLPEHRRRKKKMAGLIS